MHVSEVGNASGGGMGGMRALRGIFRQRAMESNGAGGDVRVAPYAADAQLTPAARWAAGEEDAPVAAQQHFVFDKKLEL